MENMIETSFSSFFLISEMSGFNQCFEILGADQKDRVSGNVIGEKMREVFIWSRLEDFIKCGSSTE